MAASIRLFFFSILECHEFSLKKFGRRNLAAAQHPGDLVIVTGRGLHSREGLTKKHQPNECHGTSGIFCGRSISREKFPWIFRDVIVTFFFEASGNP